jgi:hypothetical protein
MTKTQTIEQARQQITDDLNTDADTVTVGNSVINYVRHPAGNYWEMGDTRSYKYDGAAPLVDRITDADIEQYIKEHKDD